MCVTRQALPNTTVVTFDTFEQSYQRAARHHMRHDLGLSSRLHVGIGDTRHSVRSFAEAHRHVRCDLAHPAVPDRKHSDLLALHAMSRIPTALVMTTVIREQNVADKPIARSWVSAWDDGRHAWDDALRDLLILNSTCLPPNRPNAVGTDFKIIRNETFCDSTPLESLTTAFDPAKGAPT